MSEDKLDLMTKRTADADEVARDIISMEIAQSDEKAREYVTEFYKNKYQGVKFTLDEQIIMLSTLGQYREFYSWIMGDILVKIEEKITKGELGEIDSLNRFFDAYEEQIGCSRATMYNCRNMRSQIKDFDTFMQIGIKKAVIIMKVASDPKVFNRIVDKTIKEDLSATQVFDYVNEVQEKTREKESSVKREHRDELAKKSFYDITLPPGNKKQIILTCRVSRDRVNRALLALDRRIKEEIDRA